MAALLIITSIWGMKGSLRIKEAAWRTLEKEERSTGMNLVVMEGLMEWILPIVGWIRSSERPRRSNVEGWAWARDIAASAPIPPLLGPVMRTILGGETVFSSTEWVRMGMNGSPASQYLHVRPLTWSWNSSTSSIPSVWNPKLPIVNYCFGSGNSCKRQWFST